MSERRSVWRVLEDRRPASEPLAGEETADVVVVGAGITGLTAALLLQRRDLRVTILEAESVGAGTTGGTTGKVTSQHGLIYTEMVERHGWDVARSYAQANENAIRTIKTLVEELDADCNFRSASAFVYDKTGDDTETLQREYETTLELGLPAHLTEDTGLPFSVASALEFSDQAYFHPVRYCLALVGEFLRLGGRMYEGTRAHGLEESDSAVEVVSERGSVTADHAIIATLLPFVDRGGFFAKTRPSRAYGVAARLASPPPPGMYISSSSPVRSLRPWPEGGETGVIVVGENHATGDASADPGRWGELERWANDNFEVDSFEYRWSAQDYGTADGIPYVGRSPLTERTMVATGFAKWGLSNGTAAATMLADLVIGDSSPLVEAFSAGRIGDLEAVSKLVKDNAAMAAGLVAERVGRLLVPSVEDLQRGEGRIVDVNGRTAAAYRDPSGAVHMVSPTCTHLGCGVRWNDAENSWDCPCHGSRFDINGQLLTGPATSPLDQIDPIGPSSS